MSALLQSNEAVDLVMLALALNDCEAFVTKDHHTALDRFDERGFTLKLHERCPDAPLSPFRIDLRTVKHPTAPGPLSMDVVRQIGEDLGIYALSKSLRFSTIVGLPYAGTPFARWFPKRSHITGKRFRRLKLSKKVDGLSRTIIGPPHGEFEPGDTVLVIDDVITRADTKLEAIETLRVAGLTVSDVLVVVDREQGGRAELAEAGCTLHSLFRIHELLDIYERKGRITSTFKEESFAYLARYES